MAGLPADVWSNADADKIDRQIAQLPLGMLPTASDLLDRLLLAQAKSNDEILQIRLNRLQHAGKIPQALNVVQQAKIVDPQLFAIYFDLALLADGEGQACNLWAKDSSLSNAPDVSIFCRAILGEWDSAVVNYFARSSLGDLSALQTDLLRGFLDPELIDELNIPPPDMPNMTPLEFRLRDSVGHAIPTTGLSARFAFTDLQPAAGWLAQLAAAERLAIIGSIPPDQFAEIYTARVPAASGGVWDRVAAYQVLTTAASADKTNQVNAVLPPFWQISKQVGIAPVIARLLVPRLQHMSLSGTAADTKHPSSTCGCSASRASPSQTSTTSPFTG